MKDFPGGSVAKNLPANAVDRGSISCHGAPKPVHHNYGSPHGLEHVL